MPKNNAAGRLCLTDPRGGAAAPYDFIIALRSSGMNPAR